MSLDSRSKRASAIGLLLPFILTPPAPDGALNLGDRQHTVSVYSGIEAGEALPGGGVNTRAKRASSVGLLLRFILSPPAPDGTIDASDREHAAASYSRLGSIALVSSSKYAAMTNAVPYVIGLTTNAESAICGATTDEAQPIGASTNAVTPPLGATTNAV